MSEKIYKDFLWGVATSAFQIEGHITNDMTVWEKLGKFNQDGNKPKIGLAANHWENWEDDFKLLKELGVNSYRFSIEWARIEPEPDMFDESAIATYKQMITRLREYNITPMVTLHHFTHPVWFHERFPWHESRSIECFVRFVNRIADELLTDIPYVVTLNEPLVWVLAAYADAKFPPGFKNLKKMMTAFKHMLLAHAETYDLLKQKFPNMQIGIAHNFIVFKRFPKGLEIDKKLKRLIHHFYNRMILEAFADNRLKVSFPFLLSYDSEVPLNGKIDFWGINYYCRLHVRFRLHFKHPFELLSIARSSGEGKSDLGWEIYPKGLIKISRWLKPFGKPVIITENGIAANDDVMRQRFLESHLAVIDLLLKEDYPLRGYFHWSFMDNYEWLEGNRARFGLFHVDFEADHKRVLKPSGFKYKKHIQSHT